MLPSSEASPASGPRAPLSRDFWRFFGSALCYDFGFGLYFFLANLYLAELHFPERSIGLISGSLTLGTLLAAWPAGLLAKKYGLHTLLLISMTAAPLLAAARAFALTQNTQIAFAFAQGFAMSCYVVAFSPAVAALTNERNRTRGFSLTFGAGIGSGALAGLAGGYLPALLSSVSHKGSLAGGMQTVLVLSSLIILAGAPLLLRLQLVPQEEPAATHTRVELNSFLLRFFIAFALWNLACGAFAPFSSIFLSRQLKLPLHSIGTIFAASQGLQVLGVSAAPLFYRRAGVVTWIALAQAVTGAAMACLAFSHAMPVAVACWLCLNMFQYMCSPGIYSLVMTRTPEDRRAPVSALQNIISLLSLSVAAALGGVLLTRFGYARFLRADALLAAAAGALLVTLLRPSKQNTNPAAAELPSPIEQSS